MTHRFLHAICLAFVLVGLVASPATAESRKFTDKHGDVSNGLDIQRVSVANRTNWLVLRSKHRNVTKGQMGGLSYYIDTERSNRGPEFVVGGGTGGAGSDYSISRVHGWHEFGGHGQLACPLRFHVAYKRDVVRIGVGKECLAGHRGRLRVNLASGLTTRRSVDFAPAKQQFYPWVNRG